MTEDGKRGALIAALRVAARHPHILQEEAFADLAALIGELAPGGRLGVLVPESYLSLRVYAMGPGPTDAFAGFGRRIPGVEPVWTHLFVEGKVSACADMREGNEIERMAASAGSLSYVAVPCRVTEPRPRSMHGPKTYRAHDPFPAGAPETLPAGPRVVAVFVITFTKAGGLTSAAIDALQEIADALGPAIERATYLDREHRLAMILETSSDAMLAWDREGRITDVNAAAEVLASRPSNEMIGISIADLLDPAPAPDSGTSAPSGARLTLRARDTGSAASRPVTVAATVTAVEHDAQVAAHALLRDLSSVVEAERKAALHLARIKELEEQHRTLLDNAPVIIFRLDAVTRELVYLNRHAERLLGVPTAEALATPGFLRAAHADPEGIAAFDTAVGRAAGGAPAVPYEARLTRRTGDAISVRGSVYPLVSERGRVAAIEGVLADVSAEHAARARLVQADRLSTLGTLAAGVAHEINNPAAFILLGLDLLGRQLEGGGRVSSAVAASTQETLRELRASIRRIVDIARDLRLFASAPAADGTRRALVDVKSAIESAISLTRGQLLERAQIDEQLVEVPPVLMDEGRLGQVMVNLLVNAAQAIPTSGSADNRISIETRSDGHTIEIEVRDTGIGIPPENAARIWQPFFTTKSPEAGTGLGLSITRQIVERAGGTIVAESPVPGPDPRGTRFLIRLPAALDIELSGTAPASIPPESRRARVLIVEDESALARALAEEIGARHQVVIASGAEAALARLATERFDVVLCDLRMPGMSGEALYKRVLAERPDQADRFVFMTGVGFGAELTRFLAESGRVVLEKPFPASRALDAIARTVRRADPDSSRGT